MNEEYFISIDWGTSNFRLRLVKVPDLTLVEELTHPSGVKKLFQSWKQEGGDRENFFLRFLKGQMNRLQSSLKPDIAVVLSGMASSSIGIRELPYATLPFNSTGKGLLWESIRSDDFGFPLVLVSGVRTEQDVMRGEEIQWMGIAETLALESNSLFILPGTHSKHLHCQYGELLDFQTWMTGELFEIISTHSILSNSVEKGSFEAKEKEAFVEGVKAAMDDSSMAGKLFSIRVKDLFGSQSRTQNFFFLSGLLIGDELRYLPQKNLDVIFLCAEGGLAEYYNIAGLTLGLYEKLHIISPETVRQAVVRGQYTILKYQNL